MLLGARRPAAPPASFDGLDDWGRGAMSIGDIASGAAPTNPILPDGTCVADAQGTPVFYSADELRDALESDGDDDDGMTVMMNRRPACSP
eukprot:2733408-Prymnesium_polylepis.1